MHIWRVFNDSDFNVSQNQSDNEEPEMLIDGAEAQLFQDLYEESSKHEAREEVISKFFDENLVKNLDSYLLPSSHLRNLFL